jgi:hypothetical protein
MAFFGDGTNPLSSIGFVQRGMASSQVGDGCARRKTRAWQLINPQITKNKAILVKKKGRKAWDCSIGVATWQRST